MLIATGSTSLVFQGVVENEGVILKQSNKNFENVAQHEEEVLNKLRMGGISEGLPIVIERDGGKLLMKPVALPFNTELRIAHMSQLLALLKKVHNLGYVHRDIRMANLMKQSSNKILLVDWGFSVKKGVPCKYQGTILTASPHVLTNLSSGKFNFACYPADDLCSVVCLIFCSQRPDAQTYLDGLRAKNSNVHGLAKQVLQFWNEVLCGIWTDLMTAAAETNYKKLKDLLVSLLGKW